MVVKDVQRIAGADRYETNKATLRATDYDKVGVADGRNFPDALAASGLLKKYNLGLLLVNGAKPYSTAKQVEYTFGGTDSVKQDGGKRYFAILDCFFAEEIEGYKLDSLDFGINSFSHGKALLEDMMKSGKFTRDNRDIIIDIIESNKLGNPSWINDAISLTSLEYHRLYYRYFYMGELLLKQGIIPNKYLIVKAMTEKDFEESIESKFYVSMLDVVQ